MWLLGSAPLKLAAQMQAARIGSGCPGWGSGSSPSAGFWHRHPPQAGPLTGPPSPCSVLSSLILSNPVLAEPSQTSLGAARPRNQHKEASTCVRSGLPSSRVVANVLYSTEHSGLHSVVDGGQRRWLLRQSTALDWGPHPTHRPAPGMI